MKAPWTLLWLLTGSLPFFTGCAAPGEFESQAEAARAASARSGELARIWALGIDYEDLWKNDEEFETWKASAVPVLKAASVTVANLQHRGTSPGLDMDDWSDTTYYSKKIYNALHPKPKFGEIKGGFLQIPGRFAAAHYPDGRSLRTSRATCTLRDVPTTIYVYDFCAPGSDYFLRCSFWVSQSP